MISSTLITLTLIYGSTKHVSSVFTHWDYDHMNQWADDFIFCSALDESPIDIESADAIIDPEVCDNVLEWDIDYDHSLFKVINNGHALVVRPIENEVGADGNEYRTLSGNTNTIGRFKNIFRPPFSDVEEFCLDSLHFHWGESSSFGSEHLLDGVQYPLEAHFVHFNCKDATLGDMISAYQYPQNLTARDEQGIDVHELGVIGIWFEVSRRDNPFFETIFTPETISHIREPQNEEDLESVQGEEIVDGLSLADIIPDDVETAGYFAYEGSLTTPPCTDIVRWYNMKAFSYISERQLNYFRQLYIDLDANEPLAPNYREPQLNINPVYSCEEAADSDTNVDGDCECESGQMTGLTLEYVGDEDASIRVTRRTRARGRVYGVFNVKSGNSIQVKSDPSSSFRLTTGVRITDGPDGTGRTICDGSIRRCAESQIGDTVIGCPDLIIRAFEDGDGNICNAAVLAEEAEEEDNRGGYGDSDDSDDSGSGSSSADSAELSSEKKSRNVLTAFNELDPYVKYSLIGVMITFVVLSVVGCYICWVRRKKGDEDDEKDDLDREFEKIGVNTSTKPMRLATMSSVGGEYDDEDENAYLSDNGQTHQAVKVVDDENEDGTMIEMQRVMDDQDDDSSDGQ